MRFYCISGLGADERVYGNIHLTGHDLVFLSWLTPINNESLSNYASRMATLIDTSEPFGIIGVSFGGMLASEISKVLKPSRTILLSSASKQDEIPALLRLCGKLGFHQLIPAFVFQSSNRFSNFLFGAFNPEAKQVLRNILKDTDPKFVRWALGAIANWKQSEEIECIRIHGDRDKILPLRKLKTDLIVKQGGHLCTLTHGKEISSFLNEHLVIQTSERTL